MFSKLRYTHSIAFYELLLNTKKCSSPLQCASRHLLHCGEAEKISDPNYVIEQKATEIFEKMKSLDEACTPQYITSGLFRRINIGQMWHRMNLLMSFLDRKGKFTLKAVFILVTFYSPHGVEFPPKRVV